MLLTSMTFGLKKMAILHNCFLELFYHYFIEINNFPLSFSKEGVVF